MREESGSPETPLTTEAESEGRGGEGCWAPGGEAAGPSDVPAPTPPHSLAAPLRPASTAVAGDSKREEGAPPEAPLTTEEGTGEGRGEGCWAPG